jgi:hypothetical protein
LAQFERSTLPMSQRYKNSCVTLSQDNLSYLITMVANPLHHLRHCRLPPSFLYYFGCPHPSKHHWMSGDVWAQAYIVLMTKYGMGRQREGSDASAKNFQPFSVRHPLGLDYHQYQSTRQHSISTHPHTHNITCHLSTTILPFLSHFRYHIR